MNTVQDAVTYILNDKLFQPNSEGKIPIPSHWDKKDSPLYLVLGPNGSGKSFFRRLLEVALKATDECDDVLSISMQGRTTHQSRFLHYGFEENQSTGLNSAMSTVNAVKAAMFRKSPHALLLDEPDLGMDSEASAGLGGFLSDFVLDLPTHTHAVFVSSHSPFLVRQLASLEPNYIHLGLVQPPETVWDWLERPIEPRSPEVLRKIGTTRFALIDNVIRPKVYEEED